MAFADRLACAVVKDGHEHASFCEGDVATIRSHRLDFILQFGFGALQGEICVPRPTASGLLTMTMSGGSCADLFLGRHAPRAHDQSSAPTVDRRA